MPSAADRFDDLKNAGDCAFARGWLQTAFEFYSVALFFKHDADTHAKRSEVNLLLGK